ncbi:MAG TPA: NAD(P)/FAD-dependent oxidoreductase [Pseudomonadota bacterium]|nr:NAD(P)/FAD-dependent oxidoreductase [Pseudomonadota bacterium]
MKAPSIIVIGAGAAGLYAARLLHGRGAQVTLLEAADSVGGRVKSRSGFAAFPIELGAEELHGERSVSYRLARAQALPLRVCRERSHLWSDLCAGRRDVLRADDPDHLLAQQFFDALPGYAGPDGSLAQALAGLPPRARELLDAILGNEYGADSERLGLHALAAAESAWQHQGTRNYTLDGLPLVKLLETEEVKSLCGRVVKTVDWSGPQVRVTVRGGEHFTAEQVLITVPLPVLRDGDIDFTPPLPVEKLHAARGIGVGPILKIFLRFKRDLWPSRCSSLTLLGAPHAPQMWSCGQRGREPDRIMTAFVCGRAAEALLSRGARALPTLLAGLDRVLPAPGSAASALREHLIQDWSAEPFIRCGFSYPTVGSAPLRQALARPLYRPGSPRPSVVFAGEATHDRLFGSLQGALLSADRAVAELMPGTRKSAATTRRNNP